MRPLLVLVTLLLLSCHVLGGKPNGDEEDDGDAKDSEDDDEDDDEMMNPSTTTIPCNTVCILIFQPVCAINSRLIVKTFSNSCFLGVFNCQNREDFIAIAKCPCIADGITIGASKETKKNEENESDEDDD